MAEKSCVVWFTGLAGAGKTSLASALVDKINLGARTAALLDGELIRKVHRNDLGFTSQDRRKNVLRGVDVGIYAIEQGVIPVFSLISPSRVVRFKARRILKPSLFVEVFVSTPLEICEQRDPKGIYSGYHQGEIENVVGYDLDYDIPECPDFVLEGTHEDLDEAVSPIFRYLEDHGIL